MGEGFNPRRCYEWAIVDKIVLSIRLPRRWSFPVWRICPLHHWRGDLHRRRLDGRLTMHPMMVEMGRDVKDAERDLKSAASKIWLARRLRETSNAPHS